MESLNFAYNKELLISLRRAKLNGIFINAKPILLLSVIDAFSLSIILENEINISERLIDLYHHNSRIYQPGIKRTPFYKPFFHLTSDGFWFLKFKEGYSLPGHAKTPSLKWQREAIQYAYFSDSLYELLITESTREKLKEILIHQYFSKYN
jgi:putative restriction endonuclease